MAEAPIRVSYRIETAGDPEALAAKIASDQSTGTFTELPGETEAVRARCAARVEAVRPLEPVDTPVAPRPRRPRPVAPRRGGHRLPARGGRHRHRRADDDRRRRRLRRARPHRPAGPRLRPARRLVLPSRPAVRHRRLAPADGRARGADDRLDHQAVARPAAGGDRRRGPHALRGRRRLHQGRREADEPRLLAARGPGRRDHAGDPRPRADDRQEGDVRLRHLLRRPRRRCCATTTSSPRPAATPPSSTSTRSATAA